MYTIYSMYNIYNFLWRLRDLEGISKSLKYYKDAYSSLDEWATELETVQMKMQENQPEDSKALAELLNKQKVNYTSHMKTWYFTRYIHH